LREEGGRGNAGRERSNPSIIANLRVRCQKRWFWRKRIGGAAREARAAGCSIGISRALRFLIYLVFHFFCDAAIAGKMRVQLDECHGNELKCRSARGKLQS
jgi:hypothetical protein